MTNPLKVRTSPFFFAQSRYQNAFTHVKLSISTETESGLEFSLISENTLTRAFKLFRLTKEIEIGEQKFDDAVYILGDDLAIKDLISHSQSFKELCLWIAEKSLELKFTNRQVKIMGIVERDRAEALSLEATDLLARALKELNTNAVFKSHPSYIVSNLWNLLFTAVIGSIIFVSYLMKQNYVTPLGEDFRSEFYLWGVAAGFIPTTLLCLLWTILRGRHSRLYIQLLRLFFVSFICSWLIFANYFDYLNRSITQGPGMLTTTTLKRKWVNSSKQGKYPTVRFCFNPTLEMNFSRKEVCIVRRIDWNEFHSFQIGSPGPRLRVFPGYFSVKWFQVE